MAKPIHKHYRGLVAEIIKACGYRTALELGCCKFLAAGEMMRRNPKLALTCVDVAPVGSPPPGVSVIHSSTDQFFARNTDRFDFVFVDACHAAASVECDIAGALACLAPFGTVAVHDIDPAAKEWAVEAKCWDGYRALAGLKGYDLVVLPVESDGLALIRHKGDTRVDAWQRT